MSKASEAVGIQLTQDVLDALIITECTTVYASACPATNFCCDTCVSISINYYNNDTVDNENVASRIIFVDYAFTNTPKRGN